MYDIIVVGAGPAGMTAALYALRAGKSVLIFEKESFGGQISYSPCIENFPAIAKISGNEFSANLFDQITALGASVEVGTVVSISNGTTKTVTTDDGNTFEGKSVIIATGVKHRTIGLENEDGLIGKGISYCAVCDGAFFRGMDVAVVGGGDTALQDALHLSAICSKVYIIHRRNEFRGEIALIKKVEQTKNIELVLDSTVSEILSDTKLTGIKVKDKSENIREITISGLFVAIGQIPQNEYFKDLETLDKHGYFATDESTISKSLGIFIAGDCRNKTVRQLTTAVSDGAVAGVKASEYIDRI